MNNCDYMNNNNTVGNVLNKTNERLEQYQMAYIHKLNKNNDIDVSSLLSIQIIDIFILNKYHLQFIY